MFACRNKKELRSTARNEVQNTWPPAAGQCKNLHSAGFLVSTGPPIVCTKCSGRPAQDSREVCSQRRRLPITRILWMWKRNCQPHVGHGAPRDGHGIQYHTTAVTDAKQRIECEGHNKGGKVRKTAPGMAFPPR